MLVAAAGFVDKRSPNRHIYFSDARGSRKVIYFAYRQPLLLADCYRHRQSVYGAGWRQYLLFSHCKEFPLAIAMHRQRHSGSVVWTLWPNILSRLCSLVCFCLLFANHHRGDRVRVPIVSATMELSFVFFREIKAILAPSAKGKFDRSVFMEEGAFRASNSGSPSVSSSIGLILSRTVSDTFPTRLSIKGLP